MSIAAGCFPVS